MITLTDYTAIYEVKELKSFTSEIIYLSLKNWISQSIVNESITYYLCFAKKCFLL
ncbi:Putative conjugative transposon protein Tn916-like, CTn7-Orf5 [Clostridioides difficile CD002]|nr:Putative conjugative transposon protein Tn916-like, CTn7-Orf5 [Clostridioides difficile CD002]CCL09371.1 Putative conjugative transposon protein Tn916-like, CTn7-Orf5 [Clostridioides difficile E16]CCL15846.1 Putative conjugative transposon protein Tn916-like, CTn7-Orf5 [Clostridioides difficile T22]CCL23826.1 Putative conjugative transposon protein Tn916-like, CTn7-Orf5 [Clostridioides difficile T15]CCL40988.1 Putative conjugative transposon protein Tn916-like, CTn7-Orf5 [Clostridioides diff